MYHIHIQGVRNPIEVSTQEGEKVKAAIMANPSSEQMIDVNRRVFRISAVKEIEYVPDRNADREPEPAPLAKTPEEKQQLQQMLSRIRKQLEDRGVFKSNMSELHAKWRSENLDVYEKCVTCGKDLPKHLRKWCSGECKRNAIHEAHLL